MDPEILEHLGRLAELTDEELAALETRIVEHFDARQDEADLAELTAIADGVEQVRAEGVARATAAAERATAVEALRARVTPEPVAETPEEEPEAEPEPEAESEAIVPEPPVVETPEVPEAVAAAVTPPAPAAPAPVAPRPRPVALTAPRARTPQKPTRRLSITAAGDIPGHSAGQSLESDDLGRAFADKIEALRGSRMTGRIPVARVHASYPEDRLLGDNPYRNQEMIDAVVGREAIEARVSEAGGLDALVAAGGLCAPVEASYDLAQISIADRPVRDSLARFGADRGGIRFITPPEITDLASGVVVWTEANDETPADPTTKPCVTVVCGTETTVNVDAVTLCLQIGNFSRRTFPEQFARWYSLGLAQHAREAEGNMLAAMSAASTAVTDAQNLGAARDLLNTIGRAAAADRSRHRMSRDAILQVWFPAWALDAMREDLARQLPGDNALSVADAEILGYFTDRHIAPTFYLDERAGAGQIFGAEGGGGLDPWLTTVEWYLSHPGAFLFLDGGTLDLGTEIRDADLIATNDVRAFMETFEQVAFVGIESLRVRSTICVSGHTSGTVDLTCPGTGS